MPANLSNGWPDFIVPIYGQMQTIVVRYGAKVEVLPALSRKIATSWRSIFIHAADLVACRLFTMQPNNIAFQKIIDRW